MNNALGKKVISLIMKEEDIKLDEVFELWNGKNKVQGLFKFNKDTDICGYRTDFRMTGQWIVGEYDLVRLWKKDEKPLWNKGETISSGVGVEDKGYVKDYMNPYISQIITGTWKIKKTT